MAGAFDPPIPIVQVVAIDPITGAPGNVRQTLRRHLRPVAGADEVLGDVPDEPRPLEEPEERVGTIALGYPVGSEPPPPPGAVFPIGALRRKRKKLAPVVV